MLLQTSCEEHISPLVRRCGLKLLLGVINQPSFLVPLIFCIHVQSVHVVSPSLRNSETAYSFYCKPRSPLAQCRCGVLTIGTAPPHVGRTAPSITVEVQRIAITVHALCITACSRKRGFERFGLSLTADAVLHAPEEGPTKAKGSGGQRWVRDRGFVRRPGRMNGALSCMRTTQKVALRVWMSWYL